MIIPDFDVAEVGGLDVVAGNDPAFKALFGGLVINDSGVTETELGESCARRSTPRSPSDPVIVLFHQPRSAAGYIGIDASSDLEPPSVGRPRRGTTASPTCRRGSSTSGTCTMPRHPGDLEHRRRSGHLDRPDQLGTSGGVEENPTFNRFSTPFSVPLKAVSVQLQYVNTETGLQTGYATIDIATDGTGHHRPTGSTSACPAQPPTPAQHTHEDIQTGTRDQVRTRIVR